MILSLVHFRMRVSKHFISYYMYFRLKESTNIVCIIFYGKDFQTITYFSLSYIITGWFVRFMYVQDVSKLSLNVFGILNI